MLEQGRPRRLPFVLRLREIHCILPDDLAVLSRRARERRWQLRPDGRVDEQPAKDNLDATVRQSNQSGPAVVQSSAYQS